MDDHHEEEEQSAKGKSDNGGGGGGKRARRFKPWENIRKMFRRKNSDSVGISTGVESSSNHPQRLAGIFGSLTSRSRSSSLLVPSNKPQTTPYSAKASSRPDVSQSHDSFPRLDATDPYGDPFEQLDTPLPSQPPQYLMSELRAAIGVRFRPSKDDKETTDKIHSSNNPIGGGGGSSDPSLILGQVESEATFPMSLQTIPSRTNNNTNAGTTTKVVAGEINHDGDAPPGALNHSAARHKISIRPKKNHAPARRTRLVNTAGPQEGLAEELIPDPGRVEDFPLAPERKNRLAGRAPSLVKPRSLSLSRTMEQEVRDGLIAGISEAPPGKETEVQQQPSATSAGSMGKLSRSKSSVEKKFQHEVAVFWRRTKQQATGASRGIFNSGSKKEINQEEITPPAEVILESEPTQLHPGNKRKDLRKIKRDKAEKRNKKISDAANNSNAPAEDSSPSSSPPAAFLSRIFGSRRSARRKKDQKVPTPPPPALPSKSETWVLKSEMAAPVPPIPKPRTVFPSSSSAAVAPPSTKLNDEEEMEMEVDWTMPHSPPFHFAPSAARSMNRNNNAEPQEAFVRVSSPKLTRNREPSPLRHHRIHIAGLSPYQRRVARIGNGLEISDDEWDGPSDNHNSNTSPTRSFHFRPDIHHRSEHSLDQTDGHGNVSLPVNINQDFILRRAPAQSQQQPPSMTTVADNIRRSLEILKFSNTEGLKKTIDSLNQQPSNNRMSRSSDHLNLSNADPSRVGGGAESSGSMSNSTSSLNISDLGGDEDGAMEALALTSSASSLPQSVDDQKDVREDVQEVHDQFRWNVNSNTALLDNQPRRPISEPEASPEPVQMSTTPPSSISPSSPKESLPPASGLDPPTVAALDSSSSGSNKSWESRQQPSIATTPPLPSGAGGGAPMFSMSVRVQNPPDAINTGIVRFKRSVSSPSEDRTLPYQQHLNLNQTTRNSFPKPFVITTPAASNRVAPGVSQESASEPPQLQSVAAIKLVTARPWQSKEEKERQNKVALNHQQQDHKPPSPPQEQQPQPEESELVGECQSDVVKLRSKNRSPDSTGGGSSTPGRNETSELLKVFARRSLKLDPVTLPDADDEQQLSPTTNWTRPTSINHGGLVSPASRPDSSPPEEAKQLPEPPKRKKSPKPTPVKTPPVESIDPAGPASLTSTPFPLIRLPDVRSPIDGNRFISSHQVPPPPSDNNNKAEDIWKRLPRHRQLSLDRANKFNSPPAVPNDEDKGPAPPVRQSKVLDMVNNFQRHLQVT